MGNKKGNSLLETRRQNRILIKDTIYRMEPVTRAEIAEQLELTLPTITTSVNDMITEGLLEEIPLPDEMLVNFKGRRPVAIGFAADAALAIGVELGPYATRAVLMNLKGGILEYSERQPGDEDYEIMLEQVAVQIQELIEKAGNGNLLGVGIGLPGFIDGSRGVVRSIRKSGWVGRHLAADMQEKLGVPVMIDNNVRLRAVGYEMSSHEIRPDSFAYFYVSKGIACPLMVKDNVLSGYTAGAGEVGQMIVSVEKRGNELIEKTLDQLAGETVIFEECQAEMEAGNAEILRDEVEKAGTLAMKQVIKAQVRGDAAVDRILSEKLEYLGTALANVVNLINPGFVVVDSYIITNPENARKLKESAKKKFYGLNEEEIQIVFKEFDHFSGAKGAAYFVIRRCFLQNG
ncbi:ROK family transcriptional regulator [Blautia schinkii]|nr:ROK family transcriptional regulator [Blautia schinkii]